MKLGLHNVSIASSWIVVLFLVACYSYLFRSLQTTFTHPSSNFTVRVNTFRRNDLLENFLDHYTTCSKIALIQVIWSDQLYKVPDSLAMKYPDRVQFELHSSDRLSNRFKALVPPPTEAVLSVDDDLLLPCRDLYQAHNVWTSNQRALVGFSPRMNAIDAHTGGDRYLRWQHTWWNGVYSIILTKISFLHRDYLEAFFTTLPENIIRNLDDRRNCEDLAMAYVVAKKSGAPPVWTKGVVYEEASEGISSGSEHFTDRSSCLSMLREINGGDVALPPAYQKAVPVSGGWDNWKKLFIGRHFR